MSDVVARDIYDTVRIPLVQAPVANGDDYALNGTPEQFMLNCYPVSSTDPHTGEKEVWIQKRPGFTRNTDNLLTPLGAVTSTCCANISITQLNGVFVTAIYDQTNSKHVICQYGLLTVKIGEITGTSQSDQIFLTELTIANTPTVGVIWNNYAGTLSKGYFATSAAGSFPAASLTEIVDVDFPPKRGSPAVLVGGMIQMNSTTYVMTNQGEIVNSDLNSITSWNGLGTIQAISYPDNGSGLVRYKNYILAFGEDSMEFFQDVGNPSPVSPLQRMDQAFIKFGAIHAKAIIALDDTVYWLARSSSGATGMWKLDGFTPVKLTSVVEDQQIGRFTTTSGINEVHSLLPIELMGQKHIIIGGVTGRAGLFFSSNTITGDPYSFSNSIGMVTGVLTYSITENFWWYWNTRTVGSGAGAVPYAVTIFNTVNSSNSTQIWILGGNPSGNMGAYQYESRVANNLFSDFNSSNVSTPFPVIFQSNRWQVQTNKKKRVHKYRILFDSLFSNPSDAETGALLWFAIAKDSWSAIASTGVVTTRSVAIPNTTNQYYVNNLGSGRLWATGFGTVNRMSMRLRAIELDISMGSQ